MRGKRRASRGKRSLVGKAEGDKNQKAGEGGARRIKKKGHSKKLNALSVVKAAGNRHKKKHHAKSDATKAAESSSKKKPHSQSVATKAAESSSKKKHHADTVAAKAADNHHKKKKHAQSIATKADESKKKKHDKQRAKKHETESKGSGQGGSHARKHGEKRHQ
jgi:hypothetical protein